MNITGGGCQIVPQPLTSHREPSLLAASRTCCPHGLRFKCGKYTSQGPVFHSQWDPLNSKEGKEHV